MKLQNKILKSEAGSTFKLNPGDAGFMIRDGFLLVPRACIAIDNKCPSAYKAIITTCIESGWIKPVAYVREHELMWDILRSEQ